jgi:hypothetical protein
MEERWYLELANTTTQQKAEILLVWDSSNKQLDVSTTANVWENQLLSSDNTKDINTAEVLLVTFISP